MPPNVFPNGESNRQTSLVVKNMEMTVMMIELVLKVTFISKNKQIVWYQDPILPRYGRLPGTECFTRMFMSNFFCKISFLIYVCKLKIVEIILKWTNAEGKIVYGKIGQK